MQSKTRSAALLAIIGAAAAALLAPPAAGAASTSYPTNPQARNFRSTAGGWDGSTSSEGACLQGVNCPTLTNDHAPSGGSRGQGDGYIRTQISSLLGAQATSIGTYKSPAFTYEGAAGRTPKHLFLRIKRRSSLEELLSVTGNSAEYSVDLVDVSRDGATTGVVHDRPIGAQDSWLANRVLLEPASLELGDRYKLRIRSRFETGIQVVPGGSVGYDDVVLRAKRATQSPQGRRQTLRQQLRRGIGSATRTRHGLTIGVRCPGSAAPHKCGLKLSALLNRHGPKITNKRRTRLGAGKKRRVRLHVKHTYSKRVANRKRIVIKAKVKIGPRHAKVVKAVRIVKH